MLERKDKDSVSDGPATPRHVPVWAWGVIAIVAVGATILVSVGGHRAEPPESFRYDVTKHERVEPALVTFEETAPITVGTPEPRGLPRWRGWLRMFAWE